MEHRHDTADHVLCVVSDESLKAPTPRSNATPRSSRPPGKRPGFVLFVVVKPCRFPTLSDHIRRRAVRRAEDAARVRFREFMAQRAAPDAVAFPGKAFAASNIPIRMPTHFMGRDDALAGIETALKRSEGRVAITALHSLRGVGKTTLAAYALLAEFGESSPLVLNWLSGRTAMLSAPRKPSAALLLSVCGAFGWTHHSIGQPAF